MAFNMRRPLAPMMSVITEHSLMFASSRTAWIRCTCSPATTARPAIHAARSDAGVGARAWPTRNIGMSQDGNRQTRRKREMVALANERDFPHLVELAVPPEGLRDAFLEIDAFHRERRIPVRRGRSRHEVKQFYIRFCFSDAATADAFRNRFGDECLTHAPGNSAALMERLLKHGAD
jgi:hypothetical protein